MDKPLLFNFPFIASEYNKKTVTQTKESQEALTPKQALQMLKEGNERFISGNRIDRDLMKQVKQTAESQYPFAVVLTCIDSRVAPELVFDQGIGDIFTTRVPGNYVNPDILGGLEFATALVGSKLIVVLGHNSCGAIMGACENVTLGNLSQTLSHLRPAVYAVKNIYDSSDKNIVDKVAHKNVELSVQKILDRSPVIRERVVAGKLKVVGAMYDMNTGRVTFL